MSATYPYDDEATHESQSAQLEMDRLRTFITASTTSSARAEESRVQQRFSNMQYRFELTRASWTREIFKKGNRMNPHNWSLNSICAAATTADKTMPSPSSSLPVGCPPWASSIAPRTKHNSEITISRARAPLARPRTPGRKREQSYAPQTATRQTKPSADESADHLKHALAKVVTRAFHHPASDSQPRSMVRYGFKKPAHAPSCSTTSETFGRTAMGREPTTGDSASPNHCKRAALKEKDCKKTTAHRNPHMVELDEPLARTADSPPSDASPLKTDHREVQFLGCSKDLRKDTAGV
ncbi:hypothetical protein CBER1_07196 [Cercospora berteroae]|uniref:Uncharacterized protein n=1 Tax=Cercospora berteroae TaxID=357750 RepID=A0A2S6BRU7_9PEZI|nr:hypothetical protein CBER1_07196 [Cercospora berteroae]